MIYCYDYYSDHNPNHSQQSLSFWSKLDSFVYFSQLGDAIYLPICNKILITDNKITF